MLEEEKKTLRNQEVAQKLLNEATCTLSEAIEKTDLVQIQVARDMLQTARNKFKKVIKQKENLKLPQSFLPREKNALERL